MTMSFPQALLDGYRSFMGARLPRERERFAELAATGQKPEVMVIGCCDSRVSPEVIFDAGPGEIFVMRNVSNLVPPYETGGRFHGTSAALEFAVQALRVRHIVVLGHASCGGFGAFADRSAMPLSPGDFIGKWMGLIAPAADEHPRREGEDFPSYVDRLAQASIAYSLDNLMTFPCISTLVERGKLALHGAWFGVATGVLSIRDPLTGRFAPAADAPAAPASLFTCRLAETQRPMAPARATLATKIPRGS
jgi:carbonic anhydrase